MDKIVRIFFVSCIILFFFPSKGQCKREHFVYFPNTAYELNIYKIYGKKPGKTLMLIGGIQGNEPGGFLSADLYADMTLEKGNLIVVPRANFYSIILNKRGPHGDMNRKFSSEGDIDTMEDRIISILKGLISESDYLLNLHDGAGYYCPHYINRWRNPMRFGQAIIADCEQYRIPGTNRVLRLGDMARTVIRRVNPHITNSLYKFHFMNTRTGDEDSPHKEQRRSATYYALTKHYIPAFGIETSKFLPSIDLKVRYHNLVINEFKRLFGIIPESPGLILDPPRLKYLVISINNQIPIVIENGQTLLLNPGDSVKVSHIEANYERGLSLDILGYGDLNDYRKRFKIYRNTNILVRKDNHVFAEVPIKIKQKRMRYNYGKLLNENIRYFIIELGGKKLLIDNGSTIEIVEGESIKIIDVIPEINGSGIVNFKGFVGDWKSNTGEDRGFIINTATDLIKRYAIDNNKRLYEILASKDKQILGKIYVRLIPAKLKYLLMKINNRRYQLLRAGDSILLCHDDRFRVEEFNTNLSQQDGIHLSINGYSIHRGEQIRVKEICLSGKYGNKEEAEIIKGNQVLGSVFFCFKSH